MRLLAFLESVNIMEAAIDRYMQPFSGIVNLAAQIDPDKGQAMSEWATNEARWAITTLGKDDKIQWYLRFAKAYLLHKLHVHAQVVASERDPTKAPLAQQAERSYQKFAKTLSSKMGISIDEVPLYGQQVSYAPDFKRRMEHFMSLGLPGIENTQFGWQKPQDIWAAWTPIEQAWQEKASKVVDIDREDVETVIKFPDGSEWINLNKPYCDIEAKAMGHCGNAASYTEDDTVLSYRTIEKTEKGDMWKPRLTFILDNKTGLLGEMKGRANQKPDSKYHNIIIDLLMHDMVKGIKGGGYDPKNNFAMDDLPEETQDKLIDKKPALASIMHDYKKRGMTRDLMTRIIAAWDDTGVSDELTYDEKDKTFVVSTSDDLKETVIEVGGDSGKYVMDVLDGTEYMDMWMDGAPVEDLWDELPDNVIREVGDWVASQNPDAVEEWKEANDADFDPGNKGDVWELLNDYASDEEHEVRMALSRGFEDGHRIAAEKEMYEAVKSWTEGLPNDEEFDVSLSPGMQDPEANQEIHIGERSLIEIVSDFVDDLEYQGGIMSFLSANGLKGIEQPYYGWGHGDFDNDAAKESAIEALADVTA